MGCFVSSLNIDYYGVLSNVQTGSSGYYELDQGQTILFYCPPGYQLYNHGVIVPNGIATLQCPDNLQEHIELPAPNLSCPGAPIIQPPVYYSPTSAPTQRPFVPRRPTPPFPPLTHVPRITAPPVHRITASPITQPRTGAPLKTAPPAGGGGGGGDTVVVVNPEEKVEYADCLIPKMRGVVGYEGSTQKNQVEVVRFPLSEFSGTEYYHLTPHDTITFICEDPEEALYMDGGPLDPHNVNFYTFSCYDELSDSNEFNDVSIPLTCEN